MSIDRRALVARHRIELTEPDAQHALSVGNGDFAYTADITGMQTFLGYHDPGAAMGRAMAAGGGASATFASDPVLNTATMSTWGWHEMPNPDHFVLDDAMTEYETPRGPVRYPDRYDMEAAMRGTTAEADRAGAWLHVNPQRIDLGRIGLELRASADAPPETDPGVLTDVLQTLDLWTGSIDSAFTYQGAAVRVRTAAAPDSSTVAFRIESPLLPDARARVVLRFPYPSDGFFQTDDWTGPERHTSVLTADGDGLARISRTLDGTRYTTTLRIEGGGIAPGDEPHTFVITATGPLLELTATFAPGTDGEPAPSAGEVRAASARAWESFWSSGAALDLAGSTDERANELERRVVLSQYLTRVHSAGVMPPQESGLVTNSWQGKFHLEMHFWHAAHFALWGRPELLRRSLPWYRSILDSARATAHRQGYPGARWPKHVGPDGRESPSPIGSLLIWQQPHVLHLLELVWRASAEEDRAELLEQYSTVVDETATFLAAFPTERDGVLHLGPPVMPAQEFYDARTTEDPTFELAYWWWGLEIAQRWQERLGLGRRDGWTRVQERLARPRVVDGRYPAVGTSDELRRDDHPSLLAALGLVPRTPIIDPVVMSATLDDVLHDWEWPSAWGWDFPVLALTAARLGREDAVDALLRPEAKNRYTAVGHNPQMGALLPLYLPANGALLSAVALLAAGGDDGTAPAFPRSGWSVEAEGFIPWA